MPKLINPRHDIDVTRARIDAGRRASPSSCPIGLAVAAALGIEPAWSRIIDVGADGIYLEDRHGRLRRATGRLPRVARRFIADFDAGQPVEPIRFRVAIKDV